MPERCEMTVSGGAEVNCEVGEVNGEVTDIQKTFTADEVKELVVKICEFNCGAIDEYLTKHANKVFDKWLEAKQQ